MSNHERATHSPQEPVKARPIALITGLVVMALVLGLVLLRWSPPSPRAVDAPPDVFSAGRAVAIVEELLAEGQPHPIGTAANDLVRARLVARLESLGYEVQIQETIGCRVAPRYGPICAPVRNVVTRLPGRTDGLAVALMTHYDSVGAGPGVADDMSGVAALLEIARIFKAEGPLRNPVIFLITDGEEAGLVGAQGFVDDHPWAQDVGVVINWESRGTTGLSAMFETSEGNAGLIDAYASAVKRPFSNSLFFEIYKALPRDTDLSVFKQAGIPGMNFAFIEHPEHYHTPLDNTENLDAGSIQHQGESILALARALGARDLSNPPAGNAAYLDILGFGMIKWPAAWTLPLALAATLLLLVCAVLLMRRRDLSVGGLLLGWLGALLCVLLPVLLGMGIILLLGRAGSASQPWHAYPLFTRVALWAGALFCGGLVAALLGRRAGLWGLGVGAWLLWAILSVVLSLTLTSAAVILLVPAVLASILVAVVVVSGKTGSATARETIFIVAAALAGAICLLMARAFEVATGFSLSPAITLMLGLVVAALSPLLALARAEARPRTVVTVASAAVMVIAVVAALLVPPYSASMPQGLSIYHVTDAGSGKAYWVSVPDVDKTPAPLRQQFEAGAAKVFPWSSSQYLAATADPTGAAAPNLEVVSDERTGTGRTVTLRLRSPRGADKIGLWVPRAQLTSFSLEGRTLPVAESGAEYYSLWCRARQCDGLQVRLAFAGAGPVAAYVADYSYGLPTTTAALVQARPATAVPIGEGDLTVIWRRIEF